MRDVDIWVSTCGGYLSVLLQFQAYRRILEEFSQYFRVRRLNVVLVVLQDEFGLAIAKSAFSYELLHALRHGSLRTNGQTCNPMTRWPRQKLQVA